MRFSLKKQEILRGRKKIQNLFDKGSSFFLYPFRVYHMHGPDAVGQQVLFSVSRRNFKRAVDRNLIRRRMKEAYRLNKSILKEEGREVYSNIFALLYVSKTKLPFVEIEDKLKQALLRLRKVKHSK